MRLFCMTISEEDMYAPATELTTGSTFKISRWLMHLLFLLSASSAAALESDKAQDVQWTADDLNMVVNGDVRILNLANNVKVLQGTLEIIGNNAVFEYSVESGELQKVTVTGSPAHYRQQLDRDENIVEGSSQTILLYTDSLDGETIIELIGEASIVSPDSSMNCATIVYLADQALIREASGVCEGVLSSTTN
jgi:lipopolysaccharide transport protein LptA